MAGIRSNVGWTQGAKQTAKGTPNTTAVYRTPLASDDRISPRAEFATFAETDASRDAPDSTKMGGGAEGANAFGVRDSFFHTIAEQALGLKVTSGTTNYTHVVTPADVLSYQTIEQMLGDTLWEQFNDNIANELSVTVEAGGFMTATVNYMGITPIRLTSAPTGPAQAAGSVYNFNDATVSIGGAATALVRSFNFTLTNSVQFQQTDDFVPFDVFVGQREVTMGFDMLFHTLADYNLFHYGSSVGTTQSGTTATTDLNFLFSKGVNNSIEFDFDSVNYEEYPVGFDTGGDPIVVPVRARSRRNVGGLTKITVKNQTAT